MSSLKAKYGEQQGRDDRAIYRALRLVAVATNWRSPEPINPVEDRSGFVQVGRAIAGLIPHLGRPLPARFATERPIRAPDDGHRLLSDLERTSEPLGQRGVAVGDGARAVAAEFGGWGVHSGRFRVQLSDVGFRSVQEFREPLNEAIVDPRLVHLGVEQLGQPWRVDSKLDARDELLALTGAPHVIGKVAEPLAGSG